jgi:5-methylcytosine-specific restriction protein A
MPVKSLKPCKYPCCPELTNNSYCEKHIYIKKEKSKQYDKNRPDYYNWYNSSRWRNAREIFLKLHPLCIECEKQGILTASNVVDHVKPHLGDYDLFWDTSNWQSLCAHHHSVKTSKYESWNKNK